MQLGGQDPTNLKGSSIGGAIIGSIIVGIIAVVIALNNSGGIKGLAIATVVFCVIRFFTAVSRIGSK